MLNTPHLAQQQPLSDSKPLRGSFSCTQVRLRMPGSNVSRLTTKRPTVKRTVTTIIDGTQTNPRPVLWHEHLIIYIVGHGLEFPLG